MLDSLSAPIEVTLEITHGCNLNCKHCLPDAGQPKTDELNSREWKSLIKELDNLNVFKLLLTGGEPLVRDDFVELVNFIGEETEIEPYVNTNGMLMEPEFAEVLSNAGVSHVQVSLDGMRKKHNEFRGSKKSFEEAVNCISMLKNEGIHVQVSSCANADTWEEIPEVVDMCEQLNVDSFQFLALQQFGRGANLQDLTENQYDQLLTELEAKNEKYDIDIALGQRFIRERMAEKKEEILNELVDMPYYKRRLVGCVGGVSQCVIEPDGNVYPCELLRDAEFNAGNVREQQFREIWKKGFTGKTPRNVNHEDLSQSCRECDFFSFCEGGCRAIAYEQAGDFYGQDPRCPM